MDRSDLANRMKEYYEVIPKTKLMRRTPVAIRLDGKSFHTFTKGFKRPFDRVLMYSIQETMKYLCENVQGCVFGYCQSDEITLILLDYQTFETNAWFDYEVQKLCSISASMATMTFNKIFSKEAKRVFEEWQYKHRVTKDDDETDYIMKLLAAKDKGAMFDSRCFNIPKEEVTNLIYWRQLDATRNSIQMVGQAHFSHKQLQNKSCNDIQNMLLTKKNTNWNIYPVDCKRGAACYKTDEGWIIDRNMPILKGEDRKYVDDLIFI